MPVPDQTLPVVNRHAACVLEAGAWARLRIWLATFEGIEKGGMGIGIRRGDELQLLAYYWPRQLHRSAVLCEFNPTDLAPLVSLLDDLVDRHCPGHRLDLCTWVHTHPGLGIFLSGTDKQTIADLSRIDSALTAVVFDVFARNGVEYKAFAIDYREIASYASDVRLPQAFYDLFHDLNVILPARMEALGRPLEAMFTPITSYVNPASALVAAPTPSENAAGAELPHFAPGGWFRLVRYLMLARGRTFLIFPVARHMVEGVDNAILVELDGEDAVGFENLPRVLRRLLVKHPPESRYHLASSRALQLSVRFDAQVRPPYDRSGFVRANGQLMPLMPRELDLDAPWGDEPGSIVVDTLDVVTEQLRRDFGVKCHYV